MNEREGKQSGRTPWRAASLCGGAEGSVACMFRKCAGGGG